DEHRTRLARAAAAHGGKASIAENPFDEGRNPQLAGDTHLRHPLSARGRRKVRQHQLIRPISCILESSVLSGSPVTGSPNSDWNSVMARRVRAPMMPSTSMSSLPNAFKPS